MPSRGTDDLLAVPLEEFGESINGMIYGMSGVGKTSIAASLPNPVFLGSEPGIIAATRMRSRLGLTNGRGVPIRDWTKFERAVDAVEDGKYDDAEWIVVDTISTMQQLAFRYWTNSEHKRNPKMDEDIPDQGGHQKVQFLTRKMVSRLVDAPINVLFLAHLMAPENNDGSTVYLPAIEGQAKKGYAVAHYCMGLMNIVGFMGVKEVKSGEVRRIVWQHTEDKTKDIIYTAKDQYGVLGRYTDDVMMPELLAKIAAPVVAKKSKAKKSK